jgi:hypothetical protein
MDSINPYRCQRLALITDFVRETRNGGLIVELNERRERMQPGRKMLGLRGEAPTMQYVRPVARPESLPITSPTAAPVKVKTEVIKKTRDVKKTEGSRKTKDGKKSEVSKKVKVVKKTEAESTGDVKKTKTKAIVVVVIPNSDDVFYTAPTSSPIPTSTPIPAPNPVAPGVLAVRVAPAPVRPVAANYITECLRPRNPVGPKIAKLAVYVDTEEDEVIEKKVVEREETFEDKENAGVVLVGKKEVVSVETSEEKEQVVIVVEEKKEVASVETSKEKEEKKKDLSIIIEEAEEEESPVEVEAKVEVVARVEVGSEEEEESFVVIEPLEADESFLLVSSPVPTPAPALAPACVLPRSRIPVLIKKAQRAVALPVLSIQTPPEAQVQGQRRTQARPCPQATASTACRRLFGIGRASIKATINAKDPFA